jgi:hypothetical protein
MTITTTQREYGSLLKRNEYAKIGRLDAATIEAARRGAQTLARKALPKFTGRMRRATTVRVYQRPGANKGRSAVLCEITVNVPYAKAIELGTRPFTPPIAPLIAWVEGKLGIPQPEATRVAYAIRHKIQTEGITAQFNVRDFLPELRRMLDPFLRAAYRGAGGAGARAR